MYKSVALCCLCLGQIFFVSYWLQGSTLVALCLAGRGVTANYFKPLIFLLSNFLLYTRLCLICGKIHDLGCFFFPLCSRQIRLF